MLSGTRQGEQRRTANSRSVVGAEKRGERQAVADQAITDFGLEDAAGLEEPARLPDLIQIEARRHLTGFPSR